MSAITVVGAYGREYYTIVNAKKDWELNKDFKITQKGPYINKTDWETYSQGSTIIFAGLKANWILQEGQY
jgi:hypothetical protein